MNESTLTQLKIIVERAVRPVRASKLYKRKFREELLSHVSGVFEEESAKPGGDQAALERTALRFGNPSEVTSQLQQSIPASDRILRYWEAPPGESTLRTALRLAWVSGLFGLIVFFIVLFLAGWTSRWPREVLYMCINSIVSLPVYLFGLTFLTNWMRKALDSSPRRRWLKVALVAAGAWVSQLLWFVAVTWRTWEADWDYLQVALIVGWMAVMASIFPYALAKSTAVRRRYHEEWASLSV